MELDMKEDTSEKCIEVPSYIPRLFIAPSCLPKFTETVELIAEMKATLSKKTIEIKEAMHKKEQEYVEKLFEECYLLHSEIDFEESQAKVMRKELVQRIYLEVRSVKEVMAVNELMSTGGVGATPDMQCFGGKICVDGTFPKDVIKAITIAEPSRKTF